MPISPPLTFIVEGPPCVIGGVKIHPLFRDVEVGFEILFNLIASPKSGPGRDAARQIRNVRCSKITAYLRLITFFPIPPVFGST
jgi:hypothetical protein